jgi:hypothetical protein
MATSFPPEPPDASLAPGLESWLSSEDGEPRSLIVEVRTPERRVAPERGGLGEPSFAGRIVGGDREGRRRAIRELADYLDGEIGLSVRVLDSAGAVVVSADPGQARRLMGHPLTKRVRLNRPLTVRR